MQVKTKHVGFLAAFVVVGGVIAAVLAIHHGFSARDNPSAMEALAAKTMRRLAVPSRAKNMKNPVPNTPDNLHAAMAHWADHCAFCHANNGSGETEVGKNLYPKVPDMRLADTQNLTDGELYYTIKNGIRLTGMPAWGEMGDADVDSWKLVIFIRHLPNLTAEEEAEMQKMNPKGPEEWREMKENEDFLNAEPPHGSSKPKQTTKSHH